MNLSNNLRIISIGLITSFNIFRKKGISRVENKMLSEVVTQKKVEKGVALKIKAPIYLRICRKRKKKISIRVNFQTH